MTHTITTDDTEEAKRLTKADDMANCIFEIGQHIHGLRKRTDNVNTDDFALEIQGIIARNHIIIEDIWS